MTSTIHRLISYLDLLPVIDLDRMALIRKLNPIRSLFNPYFSLLNPLFFHQFNLKEMKSELTYFLVRDGYWTLLEYFMHNPKPDNQFINLIVPINHKEIIPPLWSEQVLFYDFNFLAIDFRKYDNIFLYFGSDPYQYQNRPHLSENLIRSIEDKNIFLYYEEVAQFGNANANKKLNHMLDISKFFPHSKIVDDIPNSFHNNQANGCLIDISIRKRFCFDNYNYHYFASRGKAVDHLAGVHKSELREDLSIPLSQHHSLLIYDIKAKNNYFNEIYVECKTKGIVPTLKNKAFVYYLLDNEERFNLK